MPYNTGRYNDQSRVMQDESRYWMRRGMAKTALKMKRDGPITDTYGKPLSYAKRMAGGHSEKTLEAFVSDVRKSYIPLNSEITGNHKSIKKVFVYDKQRKRMVQI